MASSTRLFDFIQTSLPTGRTPHDAGSAILTHNVPRPNVLRQLIQLGPERRSGLVGPGEQRSRRGACLVIHINIQMREDLHGGA